MAGSDDESKTVRLNEISKGYVERLVQSGTELTRASVSTLLSCLAACYRETTPAELGNDGGEEDMPMVEWYPRFQKPGLEVLLVRQVITLQGSIHQLQIRRAYAEVPEALKRPGSSGWQLSGEALLGATVALATCLEDAVPLETYMVMEQMS